MNRWLYFLLAWVGVGCLHLAQAVPSGPNATTIRSQPSACDCSEAHASEGVSCCTSTASDVAKGCPVNSESGKGGCCACVGCGKLSSSPLIFQIYRVPVAILSSGERILLTDACARARLEAPELPPPRYWLL